MTRSRPCPDGTCSHESPEVKPKREMQSRFARGHSRGGRGSDDSLEAKPTRDKQSRLVLGHSWAGDIGTSHPRPCPGGTSSHDSLVATLRRDKQTRLARGQPRAVLAVTTRPRQPRARKPLRIRPRATLGGRGSHDSLEAILEGGEAVTTRPRPYSGGRGSHDSPEATLRQETQSRLVRGQA
jgi:hypothetical protein